MTEGVRQELLLSYHLMCAPPAMMRVKRSNGERDTPENRHLSSSSQNRMCAPPASTRAASEPAASARRFRILLVSASFPERPGLRMGGATYAALTGR